VWLSKTDLRDILLFAYIYGSFWNLDLWKFLELHPWRNLILEWYDGYLLKWWLYAIKSTAAIIWWNNSRSSRTIPARKVCCAPVKMYAVAHAHICGDREIINQIIVDFIRIFWKYSKHLYRVSHNCSTNCSINCFPGVYNVVTMVTVMSREKSDSIF